jgi:putative endonuclease
MGAPQSLRRGAGFNKYTRQKGSSVNHLWFVYIVRSTSHPEQRYSGITKDDVARLKKHNQGGSPHTSRYVPWELETDMGFNEKAKAVAFKRYLKSGSGFSFAKRHF